MIVALYSPVIDLSRVPMISLIASSPTVALTWIREREWMDGSMDGRKLKGGWVLYLRIQSTRWRYCFFFHQQVCLFYAICFFNLIVFRSCLYAMVFVLSHEVISVYYIINTYIRKTLRKMTLRCFSKDLFI